MNEDILPQKSNKLSFPVKAQDIQVGDFYNGLLILSVRVGTFFTDVTFSNGGTWWKNDTDVLISRDVCMVTIEE